MTKNTTVVVKAENQPPVARKKHPKLSSRMSLGDASKEAKGLDAILKDSYGLWCANNGGGFPSPKD